MRRTVQYFALLLLLPLPAFAQQAGAFEPGPPRLWAGGSLLVAQPTGELADHIDTGFGIAGALAVRLDRAGMVGLRLEGGLDIYGSETFRVPLSNTIGGRIMVDVTTNNNIAYFGLGPQLMLPSDGIRPYIAGTVGLSYFHTTSSVKGDDSSESFASDTNHSDTVFAWGGSGGLYIPLSRGRTPIHLDLGARYHGNGSASYLTKGSIQDNEDGTIDYDPIRSQANLVSYHIGVMIGIGR